MALATKARSRSRAFKPLNPLSAARGAEAHQPSIANRRVGATGKEEKPFQKAEEGRQEARQIEEQEEENEAASCGQGRRRKGCC